jgi:hypothetical protein
MNMPWYEIVEASIPITQGDIIMGCPVVAWREDSLTVTTDYSLPERVFETFVEYVSMDTVVMTQACDLEQKKVQYVILCPHYAIDKHRAQWEIAMRQSSQNPTDRAWRSYVEDVRQGKIWNLSMLNKHDRNDVQMGIRIADFHEVFSLPRSFLEDWLSRQNKRLRLLPPYREHLSQAFARFFMRVGLPIDIPRFG